MLMMAMLTASKVTSQGRVTIPRHLRERLGIVPGSKVEFELTEDGRAILTQIGAGIPVSPLREPGGLPGPGACTDEP